MVGLGQPAAGDDAIGLQIVRALASGAPPGIALCELTDATGLLELLDGSPLLVVDAVVGAGAPGTLVSASADQLARTPAVSTHGIGLLEVIELAQVLGGEGCVAGLSVLGVAIEAPRGLGVGLSAPVAAAIGPAVAAVRAWIEEARGRTG